MTETAAKAPEIYGVSVAGVVFGPFQQYATTKKGKPRPVSELLGSADLRSEAFEALLAAAKAVEAHCRVANTPKGDLAAHNAEGALVRIQMQAAIALAESCK
jgi:hypothetical protein